MFIQIEKTADMAMLRFLPGCAVLGEGTVEFAESGETAGSPLAARLFAVAGVARVVLGPDHVAVRKADDADWQPLKPAILGVLMDHFLAGRPAVLADADDAAADYDADDAAVVADIRALLDSRIRPALAAEGGDIALRRYRAGTVDLELQDPVYDEPAFSLRIRIENTLRHYITEVEAVRFAAVPSPEATARAESLDWDDPEVTAVYRLLEDEINPAVALHGGYITLIDVKGHVAYIRLEGGCQGCGMADVTLKQGIEVAIKRAVPTIDRVLDATDHAGGANPYYQPGKEGMTPF